MHRHTFGILGRIIALMAGISTIAGLAAVAEAGSYGFPPLVQVPQGVGCYWYRGVLTCSRYCYWEVDGFRYCQLRAREATSQAPVLLVQPGPDYGPRAPYKPMK